MSIDAVEIRLKEICSSLKLYFVDQAKNNPPVSWAKVGLVFGSWFQQARMMASKTASGQASG